jgi:hypothetical protein
MLKLFERLAYDSLAMVTDEIHALLYNPAINLKYFN